MGVGGGGETGRCNRCNSEMLVVQLPQEAYAGNLRPQSPETSVVADKGSLKGSCISGPAC